MHAAQSFEFKHRPQTDAFVVFANLKSDSVSRGEKKISLKRATLAGHFHYGQFTGKHKTKWSNFSAKCNKLESNKCDAGRRRLK